MTIEIKEDIYTSSYFLNHILYIIYFPKEIAKGQGSAFNTINDGDKYIDTNNIEGYIGENYIFENTILY